MFRPLLQAQVALRVVAQVKNWPDYFADILGLVKTPFFEVHFKNGLNYRLRPRTQDRGIVTEICLENIYSPPGFEIGKADVVVDVGSHIGVFALWASRQASDGKVFCFEPNPQNFSLLNQNIEINSAKNVIASPLALSDKAGTQELHSSGEAASGSYSLVYGAQEASISVQTQTFEQALNDAGISRIDFLKMDCEGGEYAIFFTAPDSLIARISKISMEYHDLDEKRNAAALRAFLESKGFSVRVCPPMAGAHHGMLYAKR